MISKDLQIIKALLSDHWASCLSHQPNILPIFFLMNGDNLMKDLPVWLEDESRNIGTVFMPDSFYLNMQDTPGNSSYDGCENKIATAY
ncbi:MAG: hypothetical protein MZV63_46540 [Marinilabiliales bacterium]|nr:hypothetical protein [Marinilabiliales bacterium]